MTWQFLYEFAESNLENWLSDENINATFTLQDIRFNFRFQREPQYMNIFSRPLNYSKVARHTEFKLHSSRQTEIK